MIASSSVWSRWSPSLPWPSASFCAGRCSPPARAPRRCRRSAERSRKAPRRTSTASSARSPCSSSSCSSCSSRCPREDLGELIGRSIFFIVGAVFSATIGNLGMRLATRANIRVAVGGARAGRPREGHPDRVPHRRRGRHVHRRPRPARRVGRRAGLRRPGPEGAGGLRLRRRAARHVHAGRRRHLHQGRRRGRRPGRQGRAGHPRGRPAQRRDDRRQRGRQRRRLRRHGRGPVRVLRRHAGRRADPRHRRVRPAGPAVPADRAGHRRASPR